MKILHSMTRSVLIYTVSPKYLCPILLIRWVAMCIVEGSHVRIVRDQPIYAQLKWLLSLSPTINRPHINVPAFFVSSFHKIWIKNSSRGIDRFSAEFASNLHILLFIISKNRRHIYARIDILNGSERVRVKRGYIVLPWVLRCNR